MKLKNKKLQWYVLRWDFNLSKVINYNIFSDTGIQDRLYRELRLKHLYDKSGLKDYLKTEFLYYFWQRTECEFLICDMHKTDKFEKIDMWRQIEPNLDLIIKYVNDELELNFK